MKRLAVMFAVSLACASSVACRRAARPGVPPEHVLLVTIEGLRADRLSCYQHALPTSDIPATLEERLEGRAYGLDDLARAGVVWERANASSSLVVPALAALHSGRSPVETGVLRDEDALEVGEATLASELALHGFATAACISGGAHDLAARVGGGFEHVVSAPDDAAAITAALDWLEHDVGTGQPSFLWLHLSALSLPWDQPLEPRDGPLGTASARRSSVAGVEPGSSEFLARLARGELALDDATRAAFALRYDERVRASFEALAAFCAHAYDWTTSAREHRQDFSRTLAIFCGVGSFELGAHGALGNRVSSFDEALRVPLVLHHPGSVTGERVLGGAVSLEDVAPTILDAFELAPPELADGVSLFDDLDRRVSDDRPERAVVSVLPGGTYSLRSGAWRCTWTRWEGGADAALSIHDIDADPLERDDLAALHPGWVEAARARLLEWRAARRAGWPEGRELRWLGAR